MDGISFGPSLSFSELQSLMGSLLYLRYGIENSPYSHLLDPVHWADIQDMFTRDACSLLGLSVESPLSVRFAVFILQIESRCKIDGNPHT